MIHIRLIKETASQIKGSQKKRLALGISLGMLFGSAIGSINDDIELWLPIGVLLGVAFGNIFSDDGKWFDDRGKNHVYYEDFI